MFLHPVLDSNITINARKKKQGQTLLMERKTTEENALFMI